MKILNKIDALELYKKGYFGNKPRCWSVRDYLQSGFLGKVGLRTKIEGGGPWAYDVEPENVALIIKNWRELGVREEQIHVSEMAPHQFSTISGEVALSIRHYDLFFSRFKLPVREALRKAPEHAFGLTALLILKRFFDEISFSNLQKLFDNYPDSVIEFSCFEIGVGEWKANTIFWEVRNY